jgi:hypothetical protein
LLRFPGHVLGLTAVCLLLFKLTRRAPTSQGSNDALQKDCELLLVVGTHVRERREANGHYAGAFVVGDGPCALPQSAYSDSVNGSFATGN